MRIKQTLLLLLFASLLLLCGSVSAQTSTQMIQLDQSSFRPTYTDALTGVNIDPIGKDSSRRPCARIKVHVNRMTREDINQIELRIVTNNEQIKCKTADYDNGLIIELTAKPDTRFYFHHDKFGDSNEVLVNLEADKEYRMEAFLNILYPITVQSNASDVEVYIDENFVGVTGENRRLGIQEVLPGKHHLYCRRGDIRSAGQEIFVSAGDTFFVENIDIEASQPQYVVFSVEPKNAVVEIDSQQYVPEDGAVMAVLPSGVYNYSVTARGYHPQSGTFTVAGAKVERAVTLVSDATKVTLAASDGAEIYVNGKRVGEGRWSGELISGTYIFEARKSGHRTQTLSKEITSTPTSQSYTLPACTPIYGGVDIISTPIMADIAIDGKTVGRTPLKHDNILAGAHTVTISKGGYKSHTQSITVAEDKETTLSVTLIKQEIGNGVDLSLYADLSAEGTANCYLVQAAGKYKFKAVKGNSTESFGAAQSAKVLWETFGTNVTPNVGDLVADAGYKDDYIYFSTPATFNNGNASIAVYDANGSILWSWHIWCSAEGWNDHVYANNAGTMMDRNLGATSAMPSSVGALGLMYQWGRKDPFMGSSSISASTDAASTITFPSAVTSTSTTGTIEYATSNPTTFISSNSYNYDCNTRWLESEKTMYDPCPVGYRVPKGDVSGFWYTALGTSSATSEGTTWDDTNKGRHWTLADGTAAWYPAVGYRSNDRGSLNGVGEYGYCWSASPHPSSSYYAYNLHFYNGLVNPVHYNNRSGGYSVRCARE